MKNNTLNIGDLVLETTHRVLGVITKKDLDKQIVMVRWNMPIYGNSESFERIKSFVKVEDSALFQIDLAPF